MAGPALSHPCRTLSGKTRLARDAVHQALQMLRAGDRFALVACDDVVEVVVPSTGASAEADRFGEEMGPMARKAAHFAAYSVAHSRAADGKARRKGE